MSDQKKHKSKVWAWIAGVLLVLIIAGFVGWHFFKKDLANPKSKVAKPLLTNQLKKMIHDASDGLYHLEYSQFDVNIDAGQGVIADFKLIPDTNVYKQLLAAHKAPDNVFYVNTDSLLINNFGFTKTAAGRRFNIATLMMKRPVIRVVTKHQPYNDTVKTAKPSVLMGLVKDMLKITSVEKMLMRNMDFTLVNLNEPKEKRTSLKHLNIKVNGFVVDEIPANKTDTSKNSKKELTVKVKLYQIATPDSLYHINAENMMFSPAGRSLSIAKFTLEPRLSKAAFYHAVKYDKDRIHLIFNKMVMGNIDIERFLQKEQIHVGHATVGSSWGEVYNNYNWPKKQRPLRPKPYPHELLQKLAFDVTIDTMKMHSGSFRYAITAKASEETASLLMTNMEGTFTNITNNTFVKKRKPYTYAFMQAKMMGVANMHSTFKFNLLSKDGAFSYSSTMGPMDGKALNPLAKPLAMMAIQSGTIDKMIVQLNATDHAAKGNIDLYYQNMKVALLKNKSDTLKKRGFLSALSNAFLPNDNPRKNGKFRKGPVSVTRDPHESFFGFLWKCSLDGMSSAMTGFNQHKNKPNQNVVTDMLRNVIKQPEKKAGKKGKH